MRFTKLSEKVVLIKILESFYQDTSNSLAEIPKNVIALFTGVHQDGPESPPVYNLNMWCVAWFGITCAITKTLKNTHGSVTFSKVAGL